MEEPTTTTRENGESEAAAANGEGRSPRAEHEPAERTLWMGDVQPEWTDEVVMGFFGELGVKSISRPWDARADRPAMYAFVAFETEEDARRAADLDGRAVPGQRNRRFRLNPRWLSKDQNLRRRRELGVSYVPPGRSSNNRRLISPDARSDADRSYARRSRSPPSPYFDDDRRGGPLPPPPRDSYGYHRGGGAGPPPGPDPFRERYYERPGYSERLRGEERTSSPLGGGHPNGRSPPGGILEPGGGYHRPVMMSRHHRRDDRDRGGPPFNDAAGPPHARSRSRSPLDHHYPGAGGPGGAGYYPARHRGDEPEDDGYARRARAPGPDDDGRRLEGGGGGEEGREREKRPRVDDDDDDPQRLKRQFHQPQHPVGVPPDAERRGGPPPPTSASPPPPLDAKRPRGLDETDDFVRVVLEPGETTSRLATIL